jgi:hypothetical protein
MGWCRRVGTGMVVLGCRLVVRHNCIDSGPAMEEVSWVDTLRMVQGVERCTRTTVGRMRVVSIVTLMPPVVIRSLVEP